MARQTHLKRYTTMPRGGHFAALEEPELFAADLRAFLGEPTLPKSGRIPADVRWRA